MVLGEFLIDFDSLVVEINLVKLLLNSQLDVELFSESVTSWSMELEGSNVVVFSAMSSQSSVVLDLHWNIEAQDLEWNYLEIDWDNCILENLSSSSSKYTSEGASWLVWLLSVVLKVNCCKECLSWGCSGEF